MQEAATPTDHAIGVDIGGTKILAGIVDAEGNVGRTVRVETPIGSVRALADAVANVISVLTDEPAAIGLAVAGRVSGRLVTQSANLRLTDARLADAVEALIPAECVLLNDADAALAAEHAFGIARQADDVFMLTVGTGIGGSHIVSGRLMTGAHGAANEVGHMTIKSGGRLCGCGGLGCLDQYGSGRALARYARAYHRRAGGQGPIAYDLARAASEGEAYAVAAFDELGRWLALGIADVVALLDPELVVLAGGVATAGEPFEIAVRKHLDLELGRRGVHTGPRLARARLGHDAGMIGAAQTARAHAIRPRGRLEVAAR